MTRFDPKLRTGHLNANMDYQKKLVRFLENHDEATPNPEPRTPKPESRIPKRPYIPTDFLPWRLMDYSLVGSSRNPFEACWNVVTCREFQGFRVLGFGVRVGLPGEAGPLPREPRRGTPEILHHKARTPKPETTLYPYELPTVGSYGLLTRGVFMTSIRGLLKWGNMS